MQQKIYCGKIAVTLSPKLKIMNTIKFKTSLKCEGCVAKITQGLNAVPSVKKWEVDLKSPNKVLTVEGENIREADIVASLKKDGYTAEKL